METVIEEANQLLQSTQKKYDETQQLVAKAFGALEKVSQGKTEGFKIYIYIYKTRSVSLYMERLHPDILRLESITIPGSPFLN